MLLNDTMLNDKL